MADNVSNVDFDDVLSSIRRLVSDDGKDSDSGSAHPNNESKLILSPALRVEENSNTNRAADNNADKLPFVTIEEKIARLETAIGNEQGFEPEASQIEGIAQSAPTFFRSSGETDFEASIDSAFDDQKADNLPFVPSSEGAEEAQHQTQEPQATEDQVATVRDEHLAQEQNAGSPIADAEPEAIQVPADDNESSEDEVLLDEEALNDIVRAVVREELKGAFGESITRNLRRLIRKEIRAYFDLKET